MKYKATKFYVDFEKEEKWINEMAQKGMNFCDYSFFRYTFEEGTPGEYIYRIELLKELPSHPESRAYIRFMEESGVECVATWLRWTFFRKKASEGPFDIYSDLDSRISHYKRIATMIGVVGTANLIIGLVNYSHWLALGYKYGFHVNFYSGSVSILLGTVLTAFAFSYLRKIGKLKKEKHLYE